MDLHWKQWRNQQESEQQQHSPNTPKFLPQHHPPPASAPLSLFLPQPTTLPSFSDSTLTSSAPPRFPRIESCFSFAQWQELELQALIFRYMLAGAPVPPQLLQPIKKSFLHSPLPFLHLYHPPLLESGYYWGREAVDPEPGRCRRTDGKKWRCSREAVEGQKYCERHMHRGRNRSRKPVEQPHASSSPSSASFKHHHLHHHNQISSGAKADSKSLSENRDHVDGDGRSDSHVLRHFFDDWPKTVQEEEHGESNGSKNNNTGTYLSMSTQGITSSDVSLKLSTGHAENTCHVGSVGGPLAEALRSSTATSSPTSVLLQLPTTSACDTSVIST
ncbi:growth-regulating factor 4-like [Vigna unguiculata]|uniref:Growth-regulating factor n=1 Tax=Vigna unguiculata TaxID=3917 RepID=A0A4D6MWT3_VIGUN|nr:growth-regulating factor 4-like [Vigna unguiculata]QCE05936.1 Growth-regulating factor [Vigna unguiculata]